VYSHNIVGYVNVATTNTALNYCLAVPFTIGQSNGANEIFGSTLADYSEILIYNAANGSYSSVYSVPDDGATGWENTTTYASVPPPILPVGQGFFLNPAAPITNTFAGTVAINVGTTNVMSFPNAYNYLVGEVVPYGGAATLNGPIGLANSALTLPDYTEVLIYNAAAGSYTSYYIVSDDGGTGWESTIDYSSQTPPVITPGEGFFINTGGGGTWNQNL